ncbi:hypothetical protein BU26DRAFT_569778 [Trematosphaeria pertusa]|uniref:Uncharacterized protein n=1 Tax=Trematosphaeria pertusa TaxID=390896 RepID=A0A6A6I1Z0_9PLEO|nr:uncharacterized protein BU26DRAFT_569778 [Trematosphaeria pertusa]KAF2243883.1 hypothetical protein BU26DRAFT_569778 [Trematosphaeria pertusa]
MSSPGLFSRPTDPYHHPKMSNAPASRLLNAIISSLSALLGPSLWYLYQNLTLDILGNAPNANLSVQTLQHILHNRPAAIYLHNDLARAMWTGEGNDLPIIQLPRYVSEAITKMYWQWCEESFGGVVGLKKWEMLAEAAREVEASDGDGEKGKGVEECELEGVFERLSLKLRGHSVTQGDTDALLSGFAAMGLA